MTADAAFQNRTEWSFQKWTEWSNMKQAKPRDNNKHAERWTFKWRNPSRSNPTGKMESPQEPQAVLKQ